MKGYCDGGEYYGCGNPATFVFRNENTSPNAEWWRYHGRIVPPTVHACGKHLAALLAAYPVPSAQSTRFIVVPCNPNVELLQDNSPEGNETP